MNTAGAGVGVFYGFLGKYGRWMWHSVTRPAPIHEHQCAVMWEYVCTVRREWLRARVGNRVTSFA